MNKKEENIYEILEGLGFRLELCYALRTSVCHPKFGQPIAIIETDGSITLDKEIAVLFDHLLPTLKPDGRFLYQWRGAKRLTNQEIARRLLSAVERDCDFGK